MDKKSELYDKKQYLKSYFWKLNVEDFSNLILQDIQYIYQNFKEVDELNEHYSYKFELELSMYFDVLIYCLRGDQSPDFKRANKHLRLSDNIKTLVLEILRNQKYSNGRAELIRGLAMLKWDKELVVIAEETSVWSNSYLLSLELVEAITKRRIAGFSDVFMEVSQANAKNELERAIKKYLSKEDGYKKHKDDFLGQ